jgi:hypothetical protein
MSTCISIGIGIPFLRPAGAGIDAQAQAHYDRVIADGGLIPSGLVGVNNFFKTVKAIYGTSDITTAISVGLDAQVLGYKLGAGAGTTAGQAAQKLYSCSGSSGDVEQTTAASQPLLLVHSGANYWFGSGVNGNHVTTPNSVANSNNGNKEIIAKVKVRQSGLFPIVSKNNQAYILFLNTVNGFLTLNTTTDLTPLQNNFATAPISSTFEGFIKCTCEFSGGNLTIKFYTSTDGSTYTQVGADVVIAGNNFINTNSTLFVGSVNGGSDATGNIYRVTVANSIGGAPVVDFNPNTYNAATSQTQWTSSTGEVWTINTGTAATGYKGVLVDRTIVQGDGIDDKLTASGLSAITLNTRISALNPINLSGGYIIQGRQSGTGDKHLWYQTGGNIQAYTNAGGSINFGGISANSLKVLSTDFNTTLSNCLTNNANQVNGTLNSDAFTDLDVFGGTASFKNCIINTLFETSSVSTPTQKTAMYNYIRSINNL